MCYEVLLVGSIFAFYGQCELAGVDETHLLICVEFCSRCLELQVSPRFLTAER
jgi:hypothetical protein